MKIENIELLKTFLFQQCEKSRKYAHFYNRLGKKFLLLEIEDVEGLVDLIKYIAEDEKNEQYEVAIKQ